jgi:small-conductance mechanosensitive channel
MNFGTVLDTIVQTLSAPFRGEAIHQTVLAVALILAIGVAFKALQLLAGRLAKGRLSVQSAMLVKKGIRYTGIVIVCLIIFDRLGIDISALLGAAGIAGVAIGFAAQTSVSNVISGIFLIAEKPFAVGDVLTVGDVAGTVMSIDFISIKIQTFDNRFVRIPNETIIKSNVVNITRYPIRRLDIAVTVPCPSDIASILSTLAEIARGNTYVLDNPEPLIVVDKFSPSGIDILFGVWFERHDFIETKNSVYADILRVFGERNIAIASPRLDIRTLPGEKQGGLAPGSP